MEGSVVRPTRLVDRALDGAEVAARPTTRPTIDGRGGPGAIAPWRRAKRERERERESESDRANGRRVGHRSGTKMAPSN